MDDRSFLPPPAAAARFLAVDGLANARDLGGIACGDGRTTPTGVFRSENVDQVTETGWEQLYAAGIRTVLDLRQPAERALDTRPRPDWLTTVAGADPEAIVDDYLETVRRGDERAAASGRTNDEPASEALCRTFGTTTEGAFRWALAGLDLPSVVAAAGLTDADLAALRSWRQSPAD